MHNELMTASQLSTTHFATPAVQIGQKLSKTPDYQRNEDLDIHRCSELSGVVNNIQHSREQHSTDDHQELAQPCTSQLKGTTRSQLKLRTRRHLNETTRSQLHATIYLQSH